MAVFIPQLQTTWRLLYSVTLVAEINIVFSVMAFRQWTVRPTLPAAPPRPTSIVPRQEQVITTRRVARICNHEMDLYLTDHQAWRLTIGASSAPYNQNLATVGMAHSILKSLGDKPDKFQTELFVETSTGQLTPIPHGGNCANGAHSQPLVPACTRVIVFKQPPRPKRPSPPDLPCHAMPEFHQSHYDEHGPPKSTTEDYPEKPGYLLCLYDNYGIVFVSERGKCLYITRDHFVGHLFPNL